MSFTIGQVVHSRYRIDALLGQGGMGAVYRAWDVNLNIPVALKEMTPDPHADTHTLAQLRQQFSREAQVVASFDHPNLVRVTDYFSWGGSECLVMNFVKGESLAERIEREGAQSETQVLEWARQLLNALAYCHVQGVIHRDVKPQNVIVTPQGKPVLVDFGLVKLWDPRNPNTQTVIRAMGTPEYAPPEQYSVITGHTDPRSDLYSLGATLYHALTGQAPMSATDRMAMPERFALPRSLAPRVSPQTEAAILKAMELTIAQRFPTAQGMADALRGARPVPSPVPTPTKPRDKRTKLPVWVWGIGGAVLLVVLAVLFVVLAGYLMSAIPGPTRAPTAIPQSAPSSVPTVVSTPIPKPTSTPRPTPIFTPSPIPDPRVPAQDAVERFQAARSVAYSTWDTSQYYTVLAGSALESSLQTITELKDMDCRYYISDTGQMQFRYQEVSANRVVVIAPRSETQRRVCAGATSYTCYVFDGYYVVECTEDQWYITDKSVLNLSETSPCP